MGYHISSSLQDLPAQLGGTVIVRIKKYKYPAGFAAFRRCQLKMAAKFILAIQEAVSINANRRQNVNVRFRGFPAGETPQQYRQRRDLPVTLHYRSHSGH